MSIKLENVSKIYLTGEVETQAIKNSSIGAMADRIIKLNSGEIVEDFINNSKLDASQISWG